MNDLQVALIALGAAAVVGVWIYNKWQERSLRQRTEKIFRGQQPDVLLGKEADTPTDERREPVIGLQESAEPKSPPSPPAEWADEIADCIVRIDFVDAVPAPALWAARSSWAGEITKKLSWLAFDGQQWRQLDAADGADYSIVCAALQLADRQGAVSENELAVFLDGLRQLTDQFSGLAELPSRDQVLTHARALDEFCAAVDMQLGVNVIDAGGGTFSGTKLRGLAEAAGLALTEDGVFRAVDDQGMTLFSLGNLEPQPFEAEAMKSLATRGVTLSLDVPRVADGPATFGRLVAVAGQLAQGLGGQVVDGQQHPLSEAMIGGIGAKIGELQQTMSAHQIPSGGPRALRLFS